MAHSLNIRKVTKTFSPTNTQVNQSKHLFTAYGGEIPVRAVARVLVGSNMGVPLVKLGDSGSTNRLLTAAQIDVANTGLKTGAGANDQAGCGHYVYTSNTQINVGYNSNTVGALTDPCKVRFTVWLLDADR
jgi:hypothetical protein